MSRRAQLLVAGALALAMVHACIGWGVDIEEGCTVNADCDNGQVCVDGSCRKVCGTSSDCDGSQKCEDGVCVRLPGALCNRDEDCTEPGACEVLAGATCLEGECLFAAAAVGASCDDGDLCTVADACDDARVCVGTAVVCTSPPEDSCTPEDDFVTYPDVGTCVAATGECDYPPTQTYCEDCAVTCLLECEGVVCDDTEGGCASDGICLGGTPAVCEYTFADDDTPCDLDGDPVGSGNGLCDSGQCVGCTGPEHCLNPPGEAQCYDAACNGGTCEYTLRTGLDCNDGDTCTHTDVCDGSGACAGTLIICTDGSGTCGVQRSCNGSDTCTEVWPDGSTSCDDGAPCTYGDHCNGTGGCVGTPISCTDDAGTCAANRSCDGTSSCAVSYPGSGTSCNDSNACTWGDHCTGGGGCVGTPISCTDDAGTCGANRSCNNTSSCAVSYPGTGTGCDDGNVCTTGDHCNGSGGCVGGGAAADGTLCGTSWVRCCGGACTDLQYNTAHCGGCGVNCAISGMTCRLTSTGGYTCGTCITTTSCQAIYDSIATCYNAASGGNDLCNCQCPTNGVCADAGCGANMNCYDCPGDNFCTPGGAPGPCP